jgi:hypothetical protein
MSNFVLSPVKHSLDGNNKKVIAWQVAPLYRHAAGAVSALIFIFQNFFQIPLTRFAFSHV